MRTQRDVLVVDDEPVITGAVARILADEGLTVDAAASGAEGLALLADRAYRLILCDMMMTGMDGLAFLAEVVRRGASAPVVMMTGYATVENAVASLTRGAADFMAKPFTAEELLAVARRGLRYRALQAEAAAAGRRDSLAFVPCPPSYHRLGFVSWVSVEPEGGARIGVNDLFLKTLGGVAAVELAPEGAETVQGSPCATVTSETGDRHSVMCPVSGKIVGVHASLAADPPALEKDPYFEGWLYRVVPTDLSADLRNLIACSSDRL